MFSRPFHYLGKILILHLAVVEGNGAGWETHMGDFPEGFGVIGWKTQQRDKTGVIVVKIT